MELSLLLNSVQAALLPFLLPSGTLKRGLYLPFDPPVDVCVSAPTGSGKTLAYVLPIIEVIHIERRPSSASVSERYDSRSFQLG